MAADNESSPIRVLAAVLVVAGLVLFGLTYLLFDGRPLPLFAGIVLFLVGIVSLIAASNRR